MDDTQSSAYGWLPPSSPSPPPPPPPPSAPARRRGGPLRVVVLVVCTLIIGTAIGFPIGLLTRASPTSTTSPSPSASSATAANARALYRQAVAATSRSAGFHYVSVTTGGIADETFIGDATRQGGRQIITQDSSYGTEQFTLLLIAGTVYFQGNGPALQDQLGVPLARTAALTGKWVSVVAADGPYHVVAPGITVGDQAGELTLVPTSTLRISGDGGRAVTRIGGTVPPQQNAPGGTGHLDIDSSSKLPIRYVSVLSSNGVTIPSTTTFSGWGATPTLAVPTGATAWSTLGASEPPNGYGSGGGTATPAPSAAT